jgi:hypothetical protein
LWFASLPHDGKGAQNTFQAALGLGVVEKHVLVMS